MFNFSQFMIVIAMIVLFIYMIFTYKAHKECDGVLVQGAVWYECVDIKRK